MARRLKLETSSRRRRRGGKGGRRIKFPEGEFQVANLIINQFHRHYDLDADSAVFLAGVFRYLCAETLELARSKADGMGNSGIHERNLIRAVKEDEELGIAFKTSLEIHEVNQLISNLTI